MKNEGKGKKANKPQPEYLMSMSVTMPATPELMVLTPECEITTEGFCTPADSGMSISMELKR